MNNNYSFRPYSTDMVNEATTSISEQENAPDSFNDPNIIYQSGSGF